MPTRPPDPDWTWSRFLDWYFASFGSSETLVSARFAPGWQAARDLLAELQGYPGIRARYARSWLWVKYCEPIEIKEIKP